MAAFNVISCPRTPPHKITWHRTQKMKLHTCEVSDLLEYDSVISECLTIEVERTTILQNVRNRSLSSTVSCPQHHGEILKPCTVYTSLEYIFSTYVITFCRVIWHLCSTLIKDLPSATALLCQWPNRQLPIAPDVQCKHSYTLFSGLRNVALL